MAKTWTKEMKLLVDLSPGTHLWLPVATAEIINPGVMVTWTSNELVEVDAASDDATIIGVANGSSAVGETDKIQVVTKGIFQATVVSGTYTIGAGLKYDDSADDGSLVADGDANSIAWAWDYGTTVTTLKVYFDIVLIGAVAGKMFDISSA